MDTIQEYRISEATLSYKRVSIKTNTNDLRKKMTSPDSVYEIAKSILGAEGREVMLLFFVDSANKIKSISRAFTGTTDQAVIYPREVMRYCILADVTRLIMVHNHPSDNINPSEHDIEITKKIKIAGETLDIELLDHLIIGDSGYYSFREHDLI